MSFQLESRLENEPGEVRKTSAVSEQRKTHILGDATDCSGSNLVPQSVCIISMDHVVVWVLLGI